MWSTNNFDVLFFNITNLPFVILTFVDFNYIASYCCEATPDLITLFSDTSDHVHVQRKTMFLPPTAHYFNISLHNMSL